MSGEIDIYITKYALTEGIQVTRGELQNDPTRMPSATVTWPNGCNGQAMFFRKDYHLTTEAAQARVQEMIQTKRRALLKSLDRLDALAATGPKIVHIPQQ